MKTSHFNFCSWLSKVSVPDCPSFFQLSVHLMMRDHVKHLSIYWRIILKQMLRYVIGRHGLNLSGAGWGQEAGFCEHSNEPSGSIKCGEFRDWLWNCQFLNKNAAACRSLVKQNADVFIFKACGTYCNCCYSGSSGSGEIVRQNLRIVPVFVFRLSCGVCSISLSTFKSMAWQ
jgi:hypothetical protein